MYVVVTGPPASGKSTLASLLAAELGLPLLAKDTIKAGLVEALGADDLEESRQLGRAAVRALLAVAGENAGAVIDSVWVDRDRAVTDLAGLPGPVVEVFCRCDRTVLEERYVARGRSLDRPADELWNEDSLRPLAGPWPVVEVDTAEPVERFAVLERLLIDLEGAASGRSWGPRPIDPVDARGDLGLLGSVATSWARTLVGTGRRPGPFAVVITLVGTPELVAPSSWLNGPPNWFISFGDGEPDELAPARLAVERTPIRHRAHAIVWVDEAEGVVRVAAQHRLGGLTREHTAPLDPSA